MNVPTGQPQAAPYNVSERALRAFAEDYPKLAERTPALAAATLTRLALELAELAAA